MEFHVTVLALFTAVVGHKRFFAKTAEYIAAVESALEKAEPIRIEFKGVTASAGAIIIQGLVRDGALDELRDGLRGQLRDRGLAEGWTCVTGCGRRTSQWRVFARRCAMAGGWPGSWNGRGIGRSAASK